MGIIGSIIIGCLAGFCAGKLIKGGGFGFIMNLVLGLFGGVLGGWLFEQLGIQWGRTFRSARYSHYWCCCYPVGCLAD